MGALTMTYQILNVMVHILGIVISVCVSVFTFSLFQFVHCRSFPHQSASIRTRCMALCGREAYNCGKPTKQVSYEDVHDPWATNDFVVNLSLTVSLPARI